VPNTLYTIFLIYLYGLWTPRGFILGSGRRKDRRSWESALAAVFTPQPASSKLKMALYDLRLHSESVHPVLHNLMHFAWGYEYGTLKQRWQNLVQHSHLSFNLPAEVISEDPSSHWSNHILHHHLPKILSLGSLWDFCLQECHYHSSKDSCTVNGN